MLETKLTTCASLLYGWIVSRVDAGEKTKVDLQDFRAWTGEYREKAYSDREILDALSQLKEQGLINLNKTEVTLEVNQATHPNLYAQVSDKMMGDESASGNRFALLVQIIATSIFLGFASVGVGLALARLQPQILTTPHPWSVLAGDKINPDK